MTHKISLIFTFIFDNTGSFDIQKRQFTKNSVISSMLFEWKKEKIVTERKKARFFFNTHESNNKWEQRSVIRKFSVRLLPPLHPRWFLFLSVIRFQVQDGRNLAFLEKGSTLKGWPRRVLLRFMLYQYFLQNLA